MPIVDGKTLIGWGVVREKPWHFAGLFASQADAQSKAGEMGNDYVARYGEREELSDGFVSADTPTFTAMAGSIFEPLPSASNQSQRLQVVARWINRRIATVRRNGK